MISDNALLLCGHKCSPMIYLYVCGTINYRPTAHPSFSLRHLALQREQRKFFYWNASNWFPAALPWHTFCMQQQQTASRQRFICVCAGRLNSWEGEGGLQPVMLNYFQDNRAAEHERCHMKTFGLGKVWKMLIWGSRALKRDDGKEIKIVFISKVDRRLSWQLTFPHFL